MNQTSRLAISYYKTIAVINESHKIYLVQHQDTKKIFVKKILYVYNIGIYEYLHNNPIYGTPQIIEYCEEDNKLILIEEYISGQTLQEKIDLKELSVEFITSYILDLCDILHQLHNLSSPIIHRDIKPSNIIISKYNRPVLLDFNAAKFFSKSASSDTVLLGTQGYAAPEQYGFGASSPQTDIYSLGILLKEMVNSLPESTNQFDYIIDKCTKLTPSARFQNVLELKEELEKPHNKKSISFLPPGFRSLQPWKMLIAIPVYLMVFWLCLSLKVENTYGLALWLERIFCLGTMLLVIFATFNYQNIQSKVSLCNHKNKYLRYLGIFLLDLIIISSLMVTLVLIEGIFFQAF